MTPDFWFGFSLGALVGFAITITIDLLATWRKR